MKNLTWQNPEQLFVAQELINKVKSKCCGIKVNINLDNKGIVPSVYNSSMVLVILSTEIVFESKKCLVKSEKDISNDTWQSIT